MASTLDLASDGSLTLPEEALRALHVSAPAQLEWEVEDGRIVLTPTQPAANDDAWAYAPEHRAAVLRSLGQRGYRLSPNGLDEFIAAAEAAHREGRTYSPSDADLQAREATLKESGQA